MLECHAGSLLRTGPCALALRLIQAEGRQAPVLPYLERNRLDREDARQELFYEQIGQYIESKPVKKLQPIYQPIKKNMKYLLGIADIHANAKWKTNTNGQSLVFLV